MFDVLLKTGDILTSDANVFIYHTNTELEKKLKEKTNNIPIAVLLGEVRYTEYDEKVYIGINIDENGTMNYETFKESLKNATYFLKEKEKNGFRPKVTVPYKITAETPSGDWAKAYDILLLFAMDIECEIKLYDDKNSVVSSPAVKLLTKEESLKRVNELKVYTPSFGGFFPSSYSDTEYEQKQKEEKIRRLEEDTEHKRREPYQKNDLTFDELTKIVEEINEPAFDYQKKWDPFNQLNKREISYEIIENNENYEEYDGYLIVHIKTGISLIPYLKGFRQKEIYPPVMMTNEQINWFDEYDKELEKEMKKLEEKRKATQFVLEKQKLRRLTQGI